MLKSTETQGDDDDGVIWEPVKLTAYDRRRNELRELEAKRDAIEAKSEITSHDRQRLAMLETVIKKARLLFEREGQRGLNDLWRKRRGIDEYRASEGRDQYNAKRRKVRQALNSDLSNLTPEEKIQFERDRRANANWFKRQRDGGQSEVMIAAAYAERIRLREATRTTKKLHDAEEAAMRSDPIFGRF